MTRCWSAGDEVVGLTRDPEQARRSNPRVDWQPWEPTLERPPAEAFDGVDGVVHLLGERIDQRWTAEAKRRIMESRRMGTHNLVQAIAALPRRPSVLVSQSAVGYYGDRGEAIVDESDDRRRESFDAEVVREWEKAAHEIDGKDVRLVIVRTGQVLDASGGMLAELLTPFKLGLGGPLAGGGQYLSWIHIDDEVGILLWALDDERVSGVAQRDRAQPGDQPRVLQGAGRSPRAAGRDPGARASSSTSNSAASSGRCCRGGQRAVPRRTLDLGYEFRHPDLDEALRDLL